MYANFWMNGVSYAKYFVLKIFKAHCNRSQELSIPKIGKKVKEQFHLRSDLKQSLISSDLFKFETKSKVLKNFVL